MLPGQLQIRQTSMTTRQVPHPPADRGTGGGEAGAGTMNFVPHASQRFTVPIEDSLTLYFTPQLGQKP